jgi:hypothetical protein
LRRYLEAGRIALVSEHRDTGLPAALRSIPSTGDAGPMILSEAAQVAAQSKSTIWRAIKAAWPDKNDSREFQIDPAELHRVFPERTL